MAENEIKCSRRSLLVSLSEQPSGGLVRRAGVAPEQGDYC